MSFKNSQSWACQLKGECASQYACVCVCVCVCVTTGLIPERIYECLKHTHTQGRKTIGLLYLPGLDNEQINKI